MRTHVTLTVLSITVIALATAPIAEAKSKKRYRNANAPTPQSSLYASCDGGAMITADDQIKACGALIARRSSKQVRMIAHYNRANAYIHKVRLSDAIADYGAALKIRPDFADALFNRALANKMLNEPQLALSDVGAYLDLVPGDAGGLELRAALLTELGKFQLARNDLEKLLSANATKASALVLRGHVNLRTQDYVSALTDYEQVLAQNPDCAEAAYGKGAALEAMGKLDEGAERKQQALLTDPQLEAKLSALGVIRAN